MQTIELRTTGNALFDITRQVQDTVEASGVQQGFATLWVPHTTAGLTVVSCMDELGFEDIVDEMNRLVPTRVDFKHQFDTPTDASGHIKCALMGISLNCIIEEGKLVLGASQGIYFFEFDGPRSRKVYIQTTGA